MALHLLLAAAAPAQGDRASRLGSAIEQRLAEKLYHNVDVGVHIVTLDWRRTLYELNPEVLHVPASAAKIFPSAISLVKLGADHRIETPLRTDGEVRHGVLEGALHFVGRGDPALEISHLEEAAAMIRRQGVRRVSGDLVYDVSYLEVRKPRYPPNARHLYAPSRSLSPGSAISL